MTYRKIGNKTMKFVLVWIAASTALAGTAFVTEWLRPAGSIDTADISLRNLAIIAISAMSAHGAGFLVWCWRLGSVRGDNYHERAKHVTRLLFQQALFSVIGSVPLIVFWMVPGSETAPMKVDIANAASTLAFVRFALVSMIYFASFLPVLHGLVEFCLKEWQYHHENA
jgi:hypothetical protein